MTDRDTTPCSIGAEGEVRPAPDDREIDVLFVSPAKFRAVPQVGTACRVTWAELATYLSRPTIGNSKDGEGAWSPGLYRDGVRRKAALVHVCALVVDVDLAGDVDRVAEVLAGYRAIIHSTFSSTAAAPRCRVVLALAEPIDAATYEAVHVVVRAHLRSAGVEADDGAKDASRVSYAPVVRPGAIYNYRRVDGATLDAYAVLAAQPPPPPRRVAVALPSTGDGDAYVRGALRKATEAVASAPEGHRNVTLNREAYALARLDGLDDHTIATTLEDAARVAGLSPSEAAKTIASALRARRAA